MAKKTYTQEFKREAVRLAQTSGKPIAPIARELGISVTSIHQLADATLLRSCCAILIGAANLPARSIKRY